MTLNISDALANWLLRRRTKVELDPSAAAELEMLRIRSDAIRRRTDELEELARKHQADKAHGHAV